MIVRALPDHTELPCEDGTFVKNFQEHPQANLMSDCSAPTLRRLYPDGDYCVGQDTPIYWRLAVPPEPPTAGAIAPDWYLVPGARPGPDNQILRSFVLWHEKVFPLLVAEFVSEDGSGERDRTPLTGKFWIYERKIKARYYVIYDAEQGDLEVYERVRGRYRRVTPDARGHYRIEPLNLSLGLWHGRYQNKTLWWMRWYDAGGRLVPTGHELAQKERRAKQQQRRAKEQEQRARALAEQEAERERRAKEQAEQEAGRERRAKEQAEQETERERRAKELAEQRADRLAEKLRALGLDPEA